MSSPGEKTLAVPSSEIKTFDVIWRTIISICLSPIRTPWDR
uniref:ORF40c n=1 Tax=Pinus koraiensis TaxID=88728 RepID=Q85X61_PINKO|nr:ORF40c [Pinus koraiensis]